MPDTSSTSRNSLCPFCGEDAVDPRFFYDEDGVDGWECSNCGASTLGLHEDGIPGRDDWDSPRDPTHVPGGDASP